MSNLYKNVAQNSPGECAAVSLIIEPREKDLGGFSVRRLLPHHHRHMVGPWIFFDHMGPAEFPPGKGIDVRPHPHINLATVTYLFEGEILHRDSLGTEQIIRPGAINLMIAGHGITHSERSTEANRAQTQRMEGLQLWLALPEADEECEPEFHHYDAKDIPQTEADNCQIRVMIGSAYGLTSPVKTLAETLYCEIKIPAGAALTLPETEELAVYVVKGEVSIQGQALPRHHMAVCQTDHLADIVASQDSLIALVGGESLGKRHIEWNFVSSRPERIEKAKNDWRNGKFPTVPGDEKEYIPLPE